MIVLHQDPARHRAQQVAVHLRDLQAPGTDAWSSSSEPRERQPPAHGSQLAGTVRQDTPKLSRSHWVADFVASLADQLRDIRQLVIPGSGGHPRNLDDRSREIQHHDEFPVYFFATQPTWDGVCLAAQARNGAARPGVYAVITSDPEEMRQAFREGGH